MKVNSNEECNVLSQKIFKSANNELQIQKQNKALNNLNINLSNLSNLSLNNSKNLSLQNNLIKEKGKNKKKGKGKENQREKEKEKEKEIENEKEKEIEKINKYKKFCMSSSVGQRQFW